MQSRSISVLAITFVCGLAACGDDESSSMMETPGDAGTRVETVALCKAPLVECGDRCVDTRLDPEHCGGCDELCEDDAFCDEGVCVPRCGEAATLCDEGCVDTASAHEHCGSCGRVCDDDQLCDRGQCVLACGIGRVECESGCVDLQTDAQHCGDCGHACNEGEACAGGECKATSRAEPDAGPDVGSDAGLDDARSSASCCEGHLEGGCESDAIAECVCAIDEFCCTLAWDEVCVSLVSTEGCGSCGRASESDAACEPSDSADELPSVFAGTLEIELGQIETSCGSATRAELVFAYTAPLEGSYTFDTSGSAVSDSVLAVLDGMQCTGAELACNDDDGDNLLAKLTLSLEQGQEILLVVESWDGEAGAVEVSVVAGSVAPEYECAPTEISGELPASVSGSVNGGASGLSPSCAASSQGEVLYSFTAPEAGRFRFDTSGSTADTVLQVLDADCEGAELACNDDPETGDLAAIVDVELSEGQTVLVNVDSYSGEGDFQLSVALAADVVEATGCCIQHASAGCDDAEIAACVCAEDDYCCENTWDALCVSAVEDSGCGSC